MACRMEVRLATTPASRLAGLLGKEGRAGVMDGGAALVIAPCRDVHTFGMRRTIDLAFIGADGRVIAAYRDVEPRRRLRCGKAVAAIERFSSTRDPWLEVGDLLALETIGRGEQPFRNGQEDQL